MRKLRVLLCAALLGLLIPAVALVRGQLPMDVQPLIEQKYGGWAGTLRLWVYEGWTPGAGSAAGWLNRCAAAFEKAHSGVYVQPIYVDAAALRDLGTDGILPPDLVLFPPGVLESADALQPLDTPAAVRAPLRASGIGRAVPVLLGGYLWAYNADRLTGISADWRGAEQAPSLPPYEPHRRWGVALLALCAGGGTDAAGETDDPADGVDLGLPASAALPRGIQASADAFRDFDNGDAAAMPVTQREVRRLQALDDQGRGVNWRLAGHGGGMFTDQLLYIGLVAREDDGRAPLCRAFVEHLLGDACQGQLSAAGAFSVTGAPSGYASGDPLAIMDSALRTDDLVAAPAFGTGWQAEADSIVREFLDTDADPAALWDRLKASLAENPNIN